MSIIVVPAASSGAATYSMRPSRFAAYGTPIRVGGTYTVGMSFQTTAEKNCTGAEFYWVASGTETATITLFSAAGAVLAQGSASVATTGVHTVAFAAPYACVPYTRYQLGVYTPSVYTKFTTPLALTLPAANFNGGDYVHVEDYNKYVADPNSLPTLDAGSELYGVFPLVS